MIVPAECQIYPIEHIVDATDLYQDETEFNLVMRFADLFNSRVSMLHVCQEYDEAEKERIDMLNGALAGRIGKRDVKYVSQVHEHVVDGIEKYTSEHPTDLLMVFTHKRLFYEKLFNPSLAKELAFESKVSLLILKSE